MRIFVPKEIELPDFDPQSRPRAHHWRFRRPADRRRGYARRDLFVEQLFPVSLLLPPVCLGQ